MHVFFHGTYNKYIVHAHGYMYVFQLSRKGGKGDDKNLSRERAYYGNHRGKRKEGER